MRRCSFGKAWRRRPRERNMGTTGCAVVGEVVMLAQQQQQQQQPVLRFLVSRQRRSSGGDFTLVGVLLVAFSLMLLLIDSASSLAVPFRMPSTSGTSYQQQRLRPCCDFYDSWSSLLHRPQHRPCGDNYFTATTRMHSSSSSSSSKRRTSSWVLLHSTSSSHLKEGKGGRNDDDRSNLNDTKKLSPKKATKPTAKAMKFPKDSVVSRLKQAATRASAARMVAEEEEKIREVLLETKLPNATDPQGHYYDRTVGDSLPPPVTSPPPPKLASLRQLTAAIDAQLLHARRMSGGGGGGIVLQQQLQPARDSMTAIMTHNDRLESMAATTTAMSSTTHAAAAQLLALTTTRTTATSASPTVYRKHVAIVLSKPLRDDQITVEYATRIQRLVRAMLYQDYHPHVLCFVGGVTTATANIADCDVGYTYFRHLAASQNLNVTNVTYFHLERTSIQKGVALEHVADFVQQHCLPTWMDTIQNKNEPLSTLSSRRRLKLHIQFALVSSDYHLCILNDIHVRSPSQSPLRALERSQWTKRMSASATTNLAETTSNNHTTADSALPSAVTLETSWTYLYATTVGGHRGLTKTSTTTDDQDGDPVTTAFAAACYRRAQELIPVLHNLRGVTADVEFFQRDNYRVLVQARRRLVADMERLYQQQPSLAAVHKVLTPFSASSPSPTDRSSSTDNSRPMDVVLEGALLSLGRCLDLVRPAGLLTGSVPAHEFRLAVTVLDQAVSQITLACDPDRPLPPLDWGRLFQSPPPQKLRNDDQNNDYNNNDDSTSVPLQPAPLVQVLEETNCVDKDDFEIIVDD